MSLMAVVMMEVIVVMVVAMATDPGHDRLGGGTLVPTQNRTMGLLDNAENELKRNSTSQHVTSSWPMLLAWESHFRNQINPESIDCEYALTRLPRISVKCQLFLTRDATCCRVPGTLVEPAKAFTL